MPTTFGVFTVSDFTDTGYRSPVTTGVDVGHAHMVKQFTGAIEGTAYTQFSAAYSMETGIGTYVALESFEGSIDGRSGTLNFAHTATTTGADKTAELLVIVPSSGTGELAGITGSGSLEIDADGVHRLQVNYELD